MKHGPTHILLADDDEADRLLFSEAFEELRLNTIVHTVNDGVQLMDYLTMEDVILPELLFLDLNMSGKNGLEYLKEIRSNEKLKEIPIAIYSTSNSDKDVQDTFSNGANIYIHKPNDFNTLKNLLKKAIETAYSYNEDQSLNFEHFLLKI